MKNVEICCGNITFTREPHFMGQAPEVETYYEWCNFSLMGIIKEILSGSYYDGFEGELKVLETRKDEYFKIRVLGDYGYYTVEGEYYEPEYEDEDEDE